MKKNLLLIVLEIFSKIGSGLLMFLRMEYFQHTQEPRLVLGRIIFIEPLHQSLSQLLCHKTSPGKTNENITPKTNTTKITDTANTSKSW